MDEDELRVRRAIRSSYSIDMDVLPVPQGIPEPHTKDCTPGGALIEMMGLGNGVLVITAVCRDCGAYLDQRFVATEAK